MLSGISHVMLYASDVDRAVRWYRDALGFVTQYAHGGEYAALRHDHLPIQVHLHKTRNTAEIGHGPVPYFATDDLDATLAALTAKGVRTTEPKTEGGSPRFAACYDSEGNVLGLQESARTA